MLESWRVNKTNSSNARPVQREKYINFNESDDELRTFISATHFCRQNTMKALQFCIFILLSQAIIFTSASAVTRLFNCPCYVRVTRVIDSTGISDSEAFDIRVRSLTGVETRHSLKNIKLDDSTHQDALLHHFNPIIIPEHGLFKVSLTHKSSIATAAHAPSYMLTKTSFAWKEACPILIPYDIPQLSLRTKSSTHTKGSPSADTASPNIVGGLLSESGLRRYLVALVTVVQCPDGSFACRSYCSGTLIHGRWILSAAHCGLEAGLTLVHVNTPQNERGPTAIVEEVFNHPGYAEKNLNTSYNDLVVAKLNTDVIKACSKTPGLCGEMLPRAMRINKQERNVVRGDYLRIAGYGKTMFDERISDRKLRQVDAPVANFRELPKRISNAEKCHQVEKEVPDMRRVRVWSMRCMVSYLQKRHISFLTRATNRNEAKKSNHNTTSKSLHIPLSQSGR